jgi:hypothetical protein
MSALYGNQHPADYGSEYNAIAYMIRQMLADVRTITPVKVVSILGGGVGAIGRVSVQPLLDQKYGDNTGQSHEIVYNIPYFRLQGGVNGVIVDPSPGDIGIMACSDRDTSSLKNMASPVESIPPSSTMFSFADGFYVGLFFGAAPTNYIQIASSAINLQTVTTNISNNTNIGGNTVIQGNLTVNGQTTVGQNNATISDNPL